MSDSNPMFTVVIPTYGRPEFLAEAIASVTAQTFADFECVVVDDASPEPATLPPDPRLRLIRREHNGGPPAARNTGIDAARGTYVAFLDDDDVWRPERLADARGRPRASSGGDMLASHTRARGTPPRGRILEGSVSDSVLDGIIPHLGATSIERARAPHFDERYEASDDVEWWLASRRSCLWPQRRASACCTGCTREPGRARASASASRTATCSSNEHAEWFARHPRAKAFRLMRMGLSAGRIGDRRTARRLLVASFRLDPKPRTAWHALARQPRPHAEPDGRPLVSDPFASVAPHQRVRRRGAAQASGGAAPRHRIA